MTSISGAVLTWLCQGRVGASSRCMAAHLTGMQHDSSHPHDAGDFNRCLDLLDAVPDLRERLSKMSDVNAYWAALVSDWDRIEDLVRARKWSEAYAAISAATRPIEDADPDVIRLGSDCIVKITR